MIARISEKFMEDDNRWTMRPVLAITYACRKRGQKKEN
jgi:hypothetical protein